MGDQLFITLMKIRRKLSRRDLAFRYAASTTTILNITTTWILLMHKILYVGMLKKRLPSLEKNKLCLPLCFFNFNSCRIVLDCTEIQGEIPTNTETRSATFSYYKQRHTFKGSIGVAPNGVIPWACLLYPGCTSDKENVALRSVGDDETWRSDNCRQKFFDTKYVTPKRAS